MAFLTALAVGGMILLIYGSSIAPQYAEIKEGAANREMKGSGLENLALLCDPMRRGVRESTTIYPTSTGSLRAVLANLNCRGINETRSYENVEDCNNVEEKEELTFFISESGLLEARAGSQYLLTARPVDDNWCFFMEESELGEE